ncbi:MAG: MmgE/PrpD family protein, partial [Nitrospira sp.]|nr:MmgE/PrpD family protein [Nitrospira sp.]
MMLAERLAEYAEFLTFRSLPPEVIHEVKRRVLDSLACAYGAIIAPPCRIARRLATQVMVKDGATVWGTRHRTSPDLAAFANGTAVRYLDCNDTYLSREPAHPSDNIPACLAVAESLHVHGRQFIQSIVLAYEVQCRLCDAAALRPRGWDHVTYGAFSTAVATARLLKLSKIQTVHALNLAGITAGALRQTRVGEVSLWKACAFANASRNGIFAGLAAREGMTGPEAMFEGEKGFMKVISGPFSLPEMGGRHGSSYKILDTYIKPHPVEYHAQSAVEAAFAIRE